MIILLRHRKMILGTTALAAAGAVIFALLLPNLYTATVRIMPPRQNQSLAPALIGTTGELNSLTAISTGREIERSSDIYVGMLRSRSVGDAMIRRFDLTTPYHVDKISTARRRLESISAISDEKDGLITISVEDHNPRRAALMANAYVDELRKLTEALAVTQAGLRGRFFEQQMTQVKNDLAQAELALKETEQKTGLIQLDSQTKAVIGSMVNLQAGIFSKEVQLSALQSYATDDNPNVQILRREISSMRSQLASLTPGDTQLATIKVPEASMEYIRRLRDVNYDESILNLLAREHELAKLDASNNAAVIQVLDLAVVPDKKSSPQRTMIVFLITLISFSISVYCALVLERIRGNPNALAQIANLRMALFSSGRH